MKKKTASKKKKRGLSPGLLAWMAKRKAAKKTAPKKARGTVAKKAKRRTRKAKRKIAIGSTEPGQATLDKARNPSRPSLKRVEVATRPTGFW